jgi:hypothetical protein
MVFKIKNEPDLTPPLQSSLGSLRTKPDPAVSDAVSIVKSDVEPLIPDPSWKTCENENRYKRVIIKEQAARKAVAALKKMQTTLKLHIEGNPSCQTRIDKIGKCINATILLTTSILLVFSIAIWC